ncbi:FKBP-type peptidyl-prolyl cis-trans isomerase [Conyzicola sp.]|uniref:FKBP-type peptidyl-prolyl cis-trans isomerase n=1 Tax=Conyzicola sp. TaxID=1969404 RepID=UPI00398988DA
MRTLTAAIITVGLVASLSACATVGPSESSGSCEPTSMSGDASALVDATGEPGTVLTPEFPTPLITDGIEVSTISSGDGDTVYPGEIADFHVTFADATTAEVIALEGLDAASIVRRTAGDGTGLGDVLACASVGDRLGITAEAGEIGLASDPEDTTTVVLIIDVVRAFPGRADGVAQLAVNGMPAVALAPSGQPGVTIPSAEAPEDTQTATTILGSGETIEEGDGVVLHQTILSWETRAMLETTWVDGEKPAVPTTVLATEDNTGSRSGVIPALADALIGAKVGSQLLVVVPPGDDSFAEGATLPTGATATDTLVYVVDVLGIQKD